MTTETSDELAGEDALDEELIDDEETALELDDESLAPDTDDSEDDESSDDEPEEEAAALDELEAEELEMLTDDESTETIVVDEAAEMRAIRRPQIAMEGEPADEANSDEFVCTSCFLVKRTSQLANKRKVMGFGHRVYKSYDPRATLIKETAEAVFKVTGVSPLLEIALELERVALEEDGFRPDAEVHMLIEGETPTTMAKSTGLGLLEPNPPTVGVLPDVGDNLDALALSPDGGRIACGLENGRVIYTRWEYTDSAHYFSRVLMHMNPDGTDQKAFYGSNSYWPNSMFYARQIPGKPTQFVSTITGHHSNAKGGALCLFDVSKGRHEADGAVQFREVFFFSFDGITHRLQRF